MARLDREFKRLGGVPLTTDRALYAFYSKSNSLEAVISAHVDDLKGTGIPSRTAEIIAGLEKAVSYTHLTLPTILRV